LAAAANEEPTVNVLSAGMRPGTTYMDVTYRIDDPDDATVSVQVLAFVDGARSFANVIRPTTWVEGTDANLGSNIATGVERTLTWDVAADMTNDLVHLKFEVLCRDSRGLLPLEWITIPAAGGHDEMTISKNAPTDAEVLDALFWLYAEGDSGLDLTGGWLSGGPDEGELHGVPFARGASVQFYGGVYAYKRMDLQPAFVDEVLYAGIARSGVQEPESWHALNVLFEGLPVPIVGWGSDSRGASAVPLGLSNVTMIAAGSEDLCLALTGEGTVVLWGEHSEQYAPPGSLTNAAAIAAGEYHFLALTDEGTVVGWGDNSFGQAVPPAGLTNVVAIAAGCTHSLALTDEGTVVGWGDNSDRQAIPPVGLTSVVAIAAGLTHSLALADGGAVVGWGNTDDGRTTPPIALTNAIGVAAGSHHSLALTKEGVVVGWGKNHRGQAVPPAGLTNVISIAAGSDHSLALTGDERVVVWGDNALSFSSPPPCLKDILAIAAGKTRNLALLRTNGSQP